MKTLGYSVVFVGIFALVVFSLAMLRTFGQEPRKVLIVHSYNTDMAWVNDIDDGIRFALEQVGRKVARHLNVRTTYMDLRNNPDCNYYRVAALNTRFTIEDWRPEIVIIFDDLGQGLVGFNQLRFTEDTFDRWKAARDLNAWLAGDRCSLPAIDFFDLNNPAKDPPLIVFGGVNGLVTRYGYDAASNVAGIFESENPDALLDVLASLAKAYGGPVAGVSVLNDTSPTGVTQALRFEAMDWGKLTVPDPVNTGLFEEWKLAVESANEMNLMLVISLYDNLVTATGDPVPPGDVVAWTERHAKLPVLGSNVDFVSDGGMMSRVNSGSEQGEVALRIALDLLAGSNARPRKKSERFWIGMNQSLVRKRDLNLPSIYNAFEREMGAFVGSVERLHAEIGPNP